MNPILYASGVHRKKMTNLKKNCYRQTTLDRNTKHFLKLNQNLQINGQYLYLDDTFSS
ncbi:hypothetical protein HanRHA438_Chr08g0342661 [Helianthus annuus]|nr:hypothetical protein HanRHA438_Chr08g0342661 [Helianthus annuus]